MLFWTWARRLEDNFDASNRHNLRHFIHVDEKNAKLTISVDKDSSVSSKTTKEHHMDAVTTLPSLTEDDAQPATPNVTYYLPKQEKDQEGIESEEERRELVRIPTCAVFHKLTIGRGVPHSFVGQYLFIIRTHRLTEIHRFHQTMARHPRNCHFPCRCCIAYKSSTRGGSFRGREGPICRWYKPPLFTVLGI